jgi:hypothetical protein
MDKNGVPSTVKSELYNIPLYTHPAKTLTDEEILEIVIRKFGQSCYDNYFDSQWIEFARAILKKASEK